MICFVELLDLNKFPFSLPVVVIFSFELPMGKLEMFNSLSLHEGGFSTLSLEDLYSQINFLKPLFLKLCPNSICNTQVRYF